MYKILVETETVSNLRETPFRKIVNLTGKQTGTVGEEKCWPTNTQDITGKIHLYKHHHKVPTDHEETKPTITTNKIELRTQTIFISQLPRSELQAVTTILRERQQTVDSLDIINEAEDNQRTNLIICFNSVIACEETYHLLLFNFHALPLYLQQATLVITYTQNNLRKCAGIANPGLSADAQNFVQQQKWIELPRCLDCLQRLEYSLTGFSASLFQQLQKARSNPAPCQTCICLQTKAPTACALCGTPQDNWMCLVCSRVGCGRYKNADAFRHFAGEGHCLTVDLESQRVWNYLGDCFAHRVVPLQKQEMTLRFPEVALRTEARHQQSLEAAFWEYCSVVSQELQRQRAFYQRQKQQEQQKFQKEIIKTETLCRQARQELELKEQILRKLQKKYKKNEKRLQEVIESCKIQREILNNYQQTLKEESKEQTLQQVDENSEKIQQKLKILRGIEEEINSMLVKLTE